jgi:hypothetical protein
MPYQSIGFALIRVKQQLEGNWKNQFGSTLLVLAHLVSCFKLPYQVGE